MDFMLHGECVALPRRSQSSRTDPRLDAPPDSSWQAEPEVAGSVVAAVAAEDAGVTANSQRRNAREAAERR